jgi:hypothetical protein
MISVIVSSADTEMFNAFSENVTRTIGVPFEIIRVDNSSAKISICAAYNEGALRAQYQYLCFAHEDINIKTNFWGKKLIDHFNADSAAGLIGIAGNTFKTKMLSWWEHARLKDIETRRINIIQSYKYNANKMSENIRVNPLNEIKSQVVNLDGVFLATTKSIWEKNKFDEKLLTGFHGYDVDICMQVGKTKNLFVVHDILIEHFSEGKFDCECLLYYFKIHKKWKSRLPLLRENANVDKAFVYEEDFKLLRKHIKMLIKNGLPFFFIQKKFFFLVTLIDYRPSSAKFIKDVCTEWMFLLRYFFSHRLKGKH